MVRPQWAIAALNGPMAHIYVQGAGGWIGESDAEVVYDVAEILRKTLRDGNTSQQEVQVFASLLNSIDKILIWDPVLGEYRILKYFLADGTPDYDSISSLSGANYVNAITRINGLRSKTLKNQRSGDIVLLMKDDIVNDNFNEQRYTTGAACKSWHGSLNSSDSYVPMIISYPGGAKYLLEEQRMEACRLTTCSGNWNLGDLVKQIVNVQFR